MSINYSLQQDLKETLAMAEALDEYIRQDQLYGNIGGGLFSGGSLPKLTVGALLMRLRRLRVLSPDLDDRQLKTLDRAEGLHEQVQNEWSVHYQGKLLQEANSRLKSIKQFFDECYDDMRLCASVYGPEALRRTIVQEILREMAQLNIVSIDVDATARETDVKLRGLVKSSDFLWAERLIPAYPAKEFWWLYHRPPQTEA